VKQPNRPNFQSEPPACRVVAIAANYVVGVVVWIVAAGVDAWRD